MHSGAGREGVDETIHGLSEANLVRTAGEIRSATGVEVAVVVDINTADGRTLLEACPAPDILVTPTGPQPLTGDRPVSSRSRAISC